MIVKWDMTPREMAEAIMGGATELFFEAREAIEEGLSAAPFCKDMFFELCLLLEEKHTAAGCSGMTAYNTALHYAGLFPDDPDDEE